MDVATCPFEKAILSVRCTCELSTRRVVAERMNAGCRDVAAARQCRTLLALLHERARFAVKADGPVESLPFGKKMKLMVGGLTGLQAAISPAAPATHRSKTCTGWSPPPWSVLATWNDCRMTRSSRPSGPRPAGRRVVELCRAEDYSFST